MAIIGGHSHPLLAFQVAELGCDLLVLGNEFGMRLLKLAEIRPIAIEGFASAAYIIN
jgi:hypothetical protein